MAEPAPTLEQLIDTAYMVALGKQGYVYQDGTPNIVALADVLEPRVGKAVVGKLGDRSKMCVTRRDLVAEGFPKVAGPEDWATEDEPEIAEGVYKKVDSLCWRLTAIAPDGVLQSRFNSNHGLVLCRTTVNPHRTQAVYVTRNLQCLLADVIDPQRKRQKKSADRDAALMAMMINRIPEHGKRFDRELVGGLKAALQSGSDITARALEVANDDLDDEDAEVDE